MCLNQIVRLKEGHFIFKNLITEPRCGILIIFFKKSYSCIEPGLDYLMKGVLIAGCVVGVLRAPYLELPNRYFLLCLTLMERTIGNAMNGQELLLLVSSLKRWAGGRISLLPCLFGFFFKKSVRIFLVLSNSFGKCSAAKA